MQTVVLLPQKHILLGLFLFTISIGALSQNNVQLETSGYVNFNLGTSSIKEAKNHTITLFGCNTQLAETSKHWHGPKNGFVWDSTNQILSDVPYGSKIDSLTNQPYYVSKYYIASPPVFNQKSPSKINGNTNYDIGIVTPDEFIFNGDKPVQRVFLDYNILELTQIKYIDVVFDSSFDKIADSLDQKLNVDYVPFRVECADFQWLDTAGMYNAAGASGIGSFYRKSVKPTQLFLPYPIPASAKAKPDYLDCKVTILNDILFHYEVFFVVKGVKYQSINLRDHQLNHPNEPITFHCEYREELPCGCIEPKPKSPYKKD